MDSDMPNSTNSLAQVADISQLSQFMAVKFAEIQTELKFMRDAQDKQDRDIRATEADTKAIHSDLAALRTSQAEMMSDIRQLKESRGPRIHPMTWVSGIAAVALAMLVILDRFYIA